MGMDLYLVTAPSKLALKDTNFWDTIYSNNFHDEEDENRIKWATPHEVYYARKFWDLFNNLSFTKDYECGEWIPVTYRNVKEMLDVACRKTDYFDSFNSVPQLCELLYHWQDIENAGLKVFFECDW